MAGDPSIVIRGTRIAGRGPAAGHLSLPLMCGPGNSPARPGWERGTSRLEDQLRMRREIARSRGERQAHHEHRGCIKNCHRPCLGDALVGVVRGERGRPRTMEMNSKKTSVRSRKRRSMERTALIIP
jgi:hypothetical protein